MNDHIFVINHLGKITELVIGDQIAIADHSITFHQFLKHNWENFIFEKFF